MALEMKPDCERCAAPLGPGDAAWMCSYECTFCPACTESFAQRCPNCSGELVRRPRRVIGADSSARTDETAP